MFKKIIIKQQINPLQRTYTHAAAWSMSLHPTHTQRNDHAAEPRAGVAVPYMYVLPSTNVQKIKGLRTQYIYPNARVDINM